MVRTQDTSCAKKFMGKHWEMTEEKYQPPIENRRQPQFSPIEDEFELPKSGDGRGGD
jgi:hypothetical protein